MKKWILPIIIVALAAVVYLSVGGAFLPESTRLTRKIARTISDARKTEKPWVFIRNDLSALKLQRAEAYIKERRADDAIEDLIELIKEQQTPRTNIYGQQRRRISADYYFEARYYTALAAAYELKGDRVSAAKATRKAAALDKKDAELRAIEDARESARKQREKAAILD